MKVLTMGEIQQVSAGLLESQLTYFITSAFQTVITMGIKCAFASNLDRSFIVQNVGFPLLNVTTLGLGYEIANYYISYRNASVNSENET